MDYLCLHQGLSYCATQVRCKSHSPEMLQPVRDKTYLCLVVRVKGTEGNTLPPMPRGVIGPLLVLSSRFGSPASTLHIGQDQNNWAIQARCRA